MQAQNLVPFPSRLESLERREQKAHTHWNKSLEEMRLFLIEAQAIFDSGEYLEKAKNWQAYCKDYMPCSDAYIRLLKSSMPVRLIIKESLNIDAPENQVRHLREVVKDVHLQLPVYERAYKLSGGKPTKRHFEAIASVYQEAQATNAVSVDGESMPVTPVSLNAAQQEAIIEADKRYRQHIVESKPSQKLTVDVSAALLEAIPELPKTMLGKQVTLLWRKDSEDA